MSSPKNRTAPRPDLQRVLIARAALRDERLAQTLTNDGVVPALLTLDVTEPERRWYKSAGALADAQGFVDVPVKRRTLDAQFADAMHVHPSKAKSPRLKLENKGVVRLDGPLLYLPLHPTVEARIFRDLVRAIPDPDLATYHPPLPKSSRVRPVAHGRV